MATPQIKYRGDSTEVVAAQDKIIQRQEKMIQELRKTKQTSKETTSEMVTGLTSVVSSVVSAGYVLNTLKQGLIAVREEADRLAARQQQAVSGLGQLAQMATTDEQMRALLGASREMQVAAALGPEGLDPAAKIVYALESAGVGRYQKEVAQLVRGRVVAPDQMATLIDAAAGLEAAMGTEETGGFRKIVSKGFGVTRGAPAETQELLKASAVAGSAARALGISDEDLLAGTAVISKVEGAETAGVQMKQFLSAVEKKAIPGGFVKAGATVPEMVQQLQAQVAGGADIRAMIGDEIRAVAGFRTLSANQELFTENMKNINESLEANEYGLDAFGRKVRFATQVGPEQVGAQAQLGTGAQLAVAQTAEGMRANLAQAIINDMLSSEYKWTGQLGRGFDRAWWQTERAVLGDKAFIEDWGSAASPQTQAAILTAAEELRRAAENLNEVSGRQREAATANTE